MKLAIAKPMGILSVTCLMSALMSSIIVTTAAPTSSQKFIPYDNSIDSNYEIVWTGFNLFWKTDCKRKKTHQRGKSIARPDKQIACSFDEISDLAHKSMHCINNHVLKYKVLNAQLKTVENYTLDRIDMRNIFSIGNLSIAILIRSPKSVLNIGDHIWNYFLKYSSYPCQSNLDSSLTPCIPWKVHE